MEKITELRPDRNLLDPEFSGYKLSLSPIAVQNRDIGGVDVAETSDEQYSFIHQKEFVLHNHLHGDAWNSGVVYFVNCSRKIVQCRLNEELWQLESLEEVWEVPLEEPRIPGDFNISICFPSPDTAVVCDGATKFYILSTLPRSSPSEWKVLHKEVEEGGYRGFKVVDCKLVGQFPCRDLVCLFRSIKQHLEIKSEDLTESKNASKFHTVLHIDRVVEEVDGVWKLADRKKLQGPGSVEYSYVEHTGKAVYVATDISFEFPFENNPKTEGGFPDPPRYYWQQGFDEIKIWFCLADGTVKSDIGVKSSDTELLVTCKDATLLDGKFVQHIQSELTTWTLEKNKLEIIVQKMIDGGMWQTLMLNDKSGKEVVDETVVNEIHNRLSHLCSETQNGEGSTTMLNSSQLEDCDAFENESRILARIDLTDFRCTHKLMLGGQQWLLNIQLDPMKASAFCLRNDVDGCVWQPDVEEINAENWSCKHVGTFFAFGYIQASKQQKKFTVAPPDMSYIAIIDVTGHVIIYQKGIAVSGLLKNRKTGQKVQEVAVQHLVNLHITGGSQLLGAYSTNSHIFVLTSDKINVLHVNTE